MSSRTERKTLALVSLGCAKNAVDLQVMAGNLMMDEGYMLSPDPDHADVVIVNTCSFIESARQEAEAEIQRAIELKRRGQYGRIIVTGCYPQRYPKAKNLFPDVDAWQGVPKDWVEPKIPALRLTGQAFAYLKIAEGCSHRCAYCAIPKIRGKFRSRPSASILAEAKALIESGCRELNIVAQDPMLYGVDLRRKGGSSKQAKDLVELLWAIDAIPGDFWVRVLYSYPSEVTDEYLGWLVGAEHAIPYVDIPIQHTVPEVLVKMNRARAVESSVCAAELLRLCIPDVTLRTTVMTGFPGETDLRFKKLLADLKRMQFDHLGAFAYSPEEGTKGARMRGRPSRAVAEERERLVMEQQARIWAERAKRMIGETHEALVVAPGVARMASQAPEVDGVTYVDCDCVGEFVKVKLTKVSGFDFEGDVI